MVLFTMVSISKRETKIKIKSVVDQKIFVGFSLSIHSKNDGCSKKRELFFHMLISFEEKMKPLKTYLSFSMSLFAILVEK
jgi:hypothetical protein